MKLCKIVFSLFFILNALFTEGNGIDLYLKEVNLPADLEPSSINIMMSDSAGFIWLGTRQGLYRWDGLFALQYSVHNKQGSKNVTALSLGPNGQIWAGCEDGSIAYILDREITLWRPPDTTGFSRVNDILIDKAGRVWWGTNGSGLYYFDGTQTRNITMEDGLPDDYIYKLEMGALNEVWASTDRGVAVCKSWEGINTVNAYGRDYGLEDNIVRVLSKDNEGNLWLGFHKGGICFYNKQEKTFSAVDELSGFEFGIINDIEINGSAIWIADDIHGLMYTTTENPDQLAKVSFSGDNVFPKVRTMHSDKMGNLWILGKDGLYVSSGGAVTRLSQLSGHPVIGINAIAVSKNNDIFIVEGKNILKLNGSNSEIILSHFLPDNGKITDMKMDDDGLIWIATFGQGVVILDPESKKFRFVTTEKDGLINNNVLGISIRNKDVWLATLGGASHLKRSETWYTKALKSESFDKGHGLGNNFIYNILQDNSGNVWFGTDGNGLAKYDQSSFTFYDEKDGLDDDVIYAMDEDEDGNIWLSTASSGVYRFDGSDFEYYGKEKGLIGYDFISLSCHKNFVFILTESGLDIIDRTTNLVTTLNEELGIRKLQAELNCVYKVGDLVYFPTSEGVLKIDVEHLSRFSLVPQTVFDRTTVNLKSVDVSSELILSPDKNQLVFEYSGHWYLAPGKVHYNIKLNGYDPDWKSTYDRRASYASLPPGDYTFEVSSFLNRIPGESSSLKTTFKILKPIYLRWWFILAISIVLILFFYWFIKSRESRLKLAEARKKEKLEFEFQTLKNQINPHFLFNSFSTLISMIEEKPEQAVEYTDKLSDFFRDILEVKDKELVLLTEELIMIRNYYFIQHKRFGDNFKLTINLDEYVLKTKIPPLTLQLLTENAIKHNVISKNKPLIVEIKNDKGFILVTNNFQPKKNIEVSTGLGLTNIKERYRIISGKEIKIEETANTFTVILPIIK